MLIAGFGAVSAGLADVLPAPVATPAVGVLDDPCAGVPIAPNAAHRATADPYQSWMHEWLGLGFFVDDVLDRGISGQTTAQMLVRLRSDVLDLHPAVVHIMAGTNDVAGNTGPTSLADIQGNIASMVEQARAHGARVILASVPPAAAIPWRPQVQPMPAIAAMNDWLRRYAAREHLVYVDYHTMLSDGRGAFQPRLSEDGVHPNGAAYAVMRPLAAAAIRQALAQPQP